MKATIKKGTRTIAGALVTTLVVWCVVERVAAQPTPAEPPIEAGETTTQPEGIPPLSPIVYVVKEGDTLESVTAAWVRMPERVELIKDLNPGVDWEHLKAGERILLPMHVEDFVAPLPEGEVKVLAAVIIHIEGEGAMWMLAGEEEWKAATVNQMLGADTVLRTDSKSRMAVLIGLNTAMLVEPTTRITLLEMTQDGATLRSRVRFDFGAVDMSVERVRGLENDVTVATPSATLAVKGTGWRMSWDVFDGFTALGMPDNRLRAIRVEYANRMKAWLTQDDGTRERTVLPARAYGRTIYLPLTGAVGPEEVGEFEDGTHGLTWTVIEGTGLGETFRPRGLEGTIEEVKRGQGQSSGQGQSGGKRGGGGN